MKRKMHLKNKTNITIKNKITILIISTITCIIFLMGLLKKEITKIITIYTENDVKTLTTYIISEVVDNNKEELNIDNLVITSLNKQGEIVSVDFNSKNINNILTKINKEIINKLKNINNSDLNLLYSLCRVEKINNNLIYYIPYGIIKKNPLLTNIGPKIPLKISLSTSVNSNVKIDVTPYKINNSLIKILLDIKIDYSLVMPFIIKDIETNNSIPLVIKLIEGNIPNVYGGLYTNSSSLVSTETI